MTEDLAPARVAELICYPIKACAGISLRDAVMTPRGLAHDRSFLVVDPDGVFRTQRSDPRLAVIRPEIDDDGARLVLHAPGHPPCELAVRTDAERREVWMFGDAYRGIDQGDRVARWLSAVLEAPSRLVRVPPEHARVTDGEVPGTSAYADSCPVLLVGQASVAAIAARRRAAGGREVDARPFRANLIVAGWREPHLEDRVRRVQIGSCELHFAKLAIRCVVITVDQATGLRDDPGLLRTLTEYRLQPDGVAFGSKLAVARPGRLAVGDPLIVDAWQRDSGSEPSPGAG